MVKLLLIESESPPMRRNSLRAARLRFGERGTPKILKPTDAIIRISATFVCAPHSRPSRGIHLIAQPAPLVHEYCGIVEEVGSEVWSSKPGQFVIVHSSRPTAPTPTARSVINPHFQQAEFVGGAHAPELRVPLADDTLMTTPEVPSDEMVPSLLALSD
jgi:threonine dehydrogenase-like Zn-dependent dehydrogenase